MSKLKLWKFFIAPTFIALLTGGIIIVLSYSLSDNIGNWIASLWSFDFGAETVSALSTLIGGLFVLGIGIVLFKHIVMALSAPFMGPVSERIEQHLTGSNVKVDNSLKGMGKSLNRGIRINVRNLFMELLFVIPLLFMSIIPVIGLFTSFLILLVQSYYAGFGNMDYTLERHFSYKESISFVQKNRGLAYGNGLVYTLLLLIPIVGIIITLPLSTVASTVETLKRLDQQGKIKLLDG